MEIWKSIKGFEDYEISNLGRVKSLARTIYKTDGTTQTYKEKIKISTLNNKGYLQTGLSKEGKYKTNKIHRLVAIAFISNPKSKKQVNHLDGDKTNNEVYNLEWSTPSENTQHAYDNNLKTGFKGEVNKSSKLTNQNVLDIRNSKETYKSLAEKYSVSKTTIGYVIRRETWKHI